jgi:hypothetical protein
VFLFVLLDHFDGPSRATPTWKRAETGVWGAVERLWFFCVTVPLRLEPRNGLRSGRRDKNWGDALDSAGRIGVYPTSDIGKGERLMRVDSTRSPLTAGQGSHVSSQKRGPRRTQRATFTALRSRTALNVALTPVAHVAVDLRTRRIVDSLHYYRSEGR